MDFVDHTIAKLKLVSDQIRKLQTSEFPHIVGKAALEKFKFRIGQSIRNFAALPDDAKLSRKIALCRDANSAIVRIVPLLGFILRSTNVRNPLELYDPVLQICRKYLGPNANLILSSEWDFSPLTYPLTHPDLADHVLIGLPATESGNALVIPLVGHEIGHSVWRFNNLASAIEESAKRVAKDEIAKGKDRYKRYFSLPDDLDSVDKDVLFIGHWKTIINLCKRQSEEVFCDLIGLRLFGEGYLHAFQYLLAPGFDRRVSNYPDPKVRVVVLDRIARDWGVAIPPIFCESFEGASIQLTDSDQLLLDTSDATTAALVPDLVSMAGKLSDQADARLPDPANAKVALQSYAVLAPYEGEASLAEVVLAGWWGYLDPDLWTDRGVSQRGKARVLSDLVLKTIEVMEFNRRVSPSSRP